MAGHHYKTNWINEISKTVHLILKHKSCKSNIKRSCKLQGSRAVLIRQGKNNRIGQRNKAGWQRHTYTTQLVKICKILIYSFRQIYVVTAALLQNGPQVNYCHPSLYSSSTFQFFLGIHKCWLIDICVQFLHNKLVSNCSN